MSGNPDQRVDFLVELGTEELPPRALPALEAAFLKEVTQDLEAQSLDFAGARSFATPRRLALLISGLPLRQPDRKIEKKGPPMQVALDENGAPTRAAEAFARGFGVEVGALETLETPKGTWMVYRGQEAGQLTADLLPAIVERALGELPIPRRMRWGDGDAEFVRPAHWLVMLLGDQVLPARILNIDSGNETRGHRFMAPEAIPLTVPGEYPELLEARGRVLVDFSRRRDEILDQIQQAAAAVGGTPVMDAAILDEVTAIVEWPVPVTGSFDQAFLKLPPEVLIATLQEHQLYFPVKDATGALLPHFVTISNLESKEPDQVRRGNERVVHPRLADADFFWTQDSKITLGDRIPELERVVFQKGLGSMLDRSRRMADLATDLADRLKLDRDIASRAAELSKADLLTDMVGEFPELQGTMGAYYARNSGEDESVATAIAEHYLPRHAGDALPQTPAGTAVALADRLDLLAGVFALGRKPTGNRDPFGLRRAAVALLRILVEQELDLNLRELLTRACALQPVERIPEDLEDQLYDFIADRLRSWYLDGNAPIFGPGDVTFEMFESVRARQPDSLADFHQRLIAVHDFVQLDAAVSLAAANKRIANILPDGSEVTDVNSSLFCEDAERALHACVQQLASEHRHDLSHKRYAQALERLAALRPEVDAFFDDVLVMTDDEAIRTNRLALLGKLRQLFLDVADISHIPSSQ